MADFEVNRPQLHPHQKFFTNSQPLSQPAVNLIYYPSRLPLRFLNKTYGRLFIYFKLMQNELIQECLSYIKELTDFLQEKGYHVDDSRLEMLQHKYNTF